ncbi:MAG: hypothetical protein KGM24_14765, partial [Elusimicrobia bacterium]|nr:hypothetical protein [Elusimicrobiota bacterium]
SAAPAAAAPPEAPQGGAREAESARAAALFDGSGLRAVDPGDEEWLAAAVETLGRTRTGRRVLRGTRRLAETRGQATLVLLKPISNNGEFRYDSDLLVMDAAHRRTAPERSAPILAHELQHVLQRQLGLPSDALELEVESYSVESRVWSELGVEPARGSFAAEARRRLLKDPDAFLGWLGGQYDNNRLLHGDSMKGYVRWLKDERAKAVRRRARGLRDLEAARRIADAIRAEGKPKKVRRAYAREEIEPIERRLRDADDEIAWCERDLELLSSPEGRARFRAYSRRVVRRARAVSASAR